MTEAIVVFKSMCTRILFFAHGFFCIFLGAMYFNSTLLWICSISMAALFLEMVYTLWWRKGQEYRYFWPSGFFYIMTIIPIIWVFDMATLGIIKQQTVVGQKTFMKMAKDDVSRLIFELGLIFGIIIGRWLMPRGKMTRDQLSALLIGYVGTAADIVELKVETQVGEKGKIPITMAVLAAYTWAILQFTLSTTATLKDKTAEKAEEKEKTSRKISLNLGHYNNKVSPEEKYSAPTRKDSRVKKSSTISYSKQYNNNNGQIKEMTAKEQYIESIKRQRSQTMEKAGNSRTFSVSARKVSDLNRATRPTRGPPHKSTQSFDGEADQKKSKLRNLHGELFQILVTLLMQDGPFLVLRLVLLVEFSVNTEMHILFLAKNAMVCTLLVYRLCILTCRADDAEEQLQKEEAASKLHNVQLAVMAGNIMRSSVRQNRKI